MRMLVYGLMLALAPSLASAEMVFRSYQTKKYGHKHMKGYKQTPESKAQIMQFKRKTIEAVSIPGHADISAMVSLPEDQGMCGSCWDFALTKALRSEYMMAGKKDLAVLEFNYLLNNCGPGPKMYGCNGGDFAAALSFEQDHGPGFNSANPYTAKPGKCKNLKPEATAISYMMLGPANGQPSFKDLAYAIGVENHMLVTDVAAGAGDWENYAGGIYTGCVHAQTDHMLNIVGYDCQTSVDSNGKCVFDSAGKPVKGDGYLLLMNQWSENWGTKAANGHGGYMKTRMYDKNGRHCNAVAEDVLYFSVEQAPVPPKPDPIVTPTPDPVPPSPEKKCDKFLCSLWCGLPWCD